MFYNTPVTDNRTEDVSGDLRNSVEMECYLATSYFDNTSNVSQIFCNNSWDGISCWPVTEAGSIATVACFSELNGVSYDVTGNASRKCLENATWSSWSNYRSCKPLKLHEDEYYQVLWNMKEAGTIYYIGYGFSLIALTLALWVFLYFRDLRCLRNTIHTNLILTYLLTDITWILTGNLQSSRSYTANRIACFLVILLTYLMGTNFFWMFVEGLYLFILVVRTFSVDNVKLKIYVAIGWGIPAVVVLIWAAVKGCLSHKLNDPFVPQGCPWQSRDYYDYIFISPVILVLVVNIFFLAKVMWVLIIKLRASNTVESKQYRVSSLLCSTVFLMEKYRIQFGITWRGAKYSRQLILVIIGS